MALIAGRISDRRLPFFDPILGVSDARRRQGMRAIEIANGLKSRGERTLVTISSHAEGAMTEVSSGVP